MKLQLCMAAILGWLILRTGAGIACTSTNVEFDMQEKIPVLNNSPLFARSSFSMEAGKRLAKCIKRPLCD